MSDINILVPRRKLEGMTRRDRKKQETRWRIYDAAIKLISRRGYEAVKIEEICEEADVSNPAFFHHFSNKASLMRAYIEKLKQDIAEKLEEIPEASAREKLQVISEEHRKSSETSAAFTPQLLGALTTGEARLKMDQVNTGLTGLLAQVIKDGQSAGEFDKKWNPEVVAVSLVSAWTILPLAQNDPEFPSNPHEENLDLVLTALS